MRYGRLLAATAGLVALLPPAAAQLHTHSKTVTDAELLTLPDYCQARLMKSSPMREVWMQRLGKDGFNHLHHYCFGLTYLRRAGAQADGKQRRFFAQRAVTNFDYVLQRWKPGFLLYEPAQAGRMQAQALAR